MEGDVEERSGRVARRALARLLGDLERLERMQAPTWPARERIATELGPDGARLIAALLPSRGRPPKRRPSVVG